MRELIKFESKKIVNRKSTIISNLIIILFTAWLFILPAFQTQTTDLQGNSHKGLSAINVQKEIALQQPSVLTEEELGDMIQEFRMISDDPASYIENENGEKEFTSEILHSFYSFNYPILDVVANTFSDPEVYSLPDYVLEIPVQEDGTLGFYQQYQENQSIIMERNNPRNGGRMTDQEKSYWQQQTAKIKTPYRYGYYAGWDSIIDRIAFIPMMILMICISLAPIFASEYQEGTDVLILSSKYGKSKVIGAKLLVSFLFSILVYSITMALAIGGSLALFGTEGADLPIQLRIPNSPFPWSMSETVWIHAGLGLIILLGMVAITLFLSSKMSTPIPVLIANVMLLIIPFVIPTGTKSAVYNLFVDLLPGVQLQLKFADHMTYSIGGWTTNLFVMSAIVYLLIILISIPLAVRGFRKHQVA
ncbi:ABC transporter permease [Amphibacillus sp. Q70]|uniref:ABC transporter permease n=1 Tax=Amphibacillus sp. Q70 TaxID=3453416 RepID=UPI003F8352CC